PSWLCFVIALYVDDGASPFLRACTLSNSAIAWLSCRLIMASYRNNLSSSSFSGKKRWSRDLERPIQPPSGADAAATGAHCLGRSKNVFELTPRNVGECPCTLPSSPPNL